MGDKKNISYQKYAGKYITNQIDKLYKNLAGINLNSNIEYVHQARVACRRLRTGLWLLRRILPKEKRKTWDREIKILAKSLGQVRDLDTYIDFLESGKLPSQRKYWSGLKQIIEILRKKRVSLAKAILVSINNFKSKNVLKNIKIFINDILPAQKFKARFISLKFNKAIEKRLKALLAFKKYIYKKQCQKQLHRMRIAAKHLRYNLEILSPIFGHALDDFANEARKIQTELGNFHDLGVWAKYPGLAKEKFSKDIKEAARYLKKQCLILQDKSFQEFRKLWEHQRKNKVWEDLLINQF